MSFFCKKSYKKFNDLLCSEEEMAEICAILQLYNEKSDIFQQYGILFSNKLTDKETNEPNYKIKYTKEGKVNKPLYTNAPIFDVNDVFMQGNVNAIVNPKKIRRHFIKFLATDNDNINNFISLQPRFIKESETLFGFIDWKQIRDQPSDKVVSYYYKLLENRLIECYKYTMCHYSKSSLNEIIRQLNIKFPELIQTYFAYYDSELIKITEPTEIIQDLQTAFYDPLTYIPKSIKTSTIKRRTPINTYDRESRSDEIAAYAREARIQEVKDREKNIVSRKSPVKHLEHKYIDPLSYIPRSIKKGTIQRRQHEAETRAQNIENVKKAKLASKVSQSRKVADAQVEVMENLIDAQKRAEMNLETFEKNFPKFNSNTKKSLSKSSINQMSRKNSPPKSINQTSRKKSPLRSINQTSRKNSPPKSINQTSTKKTKPKSDIPTSYQDVVANAIKGRTSKL